MAPGRTESLTGDVRSPPSRDTAVARGQSFGIEEADVEHYKLPRTGAVAARRADSSSRSRKLPGSTLRTIHAHRSLIDPIDRKIKKSLHFPRA